MVFLLHIRQSGNSRESLALASEESTKYTAASDKIMEVGNCVHIAMFSSQLQSLETEFGLFYVSENTLIDSNNTNKQKMHFLEQVRAL